MAPELHQADSLDESPLRALLPHAQVNSEKRLLKVFLFLDQAPPSCSRLLVPEDMENRRSARDTHRDFGGDSQEEIGIFTAGEIGLEMSSAGLCLWDFISDVLASHSLTHSNLRVVRYLGYIGAFLLFLTVLVNMWVSFAFRRQFGLIFLHYEQRTWTQLTLFFFSVLAVTNCEILGVGLCLLLLTAAPDKVMVETIELATIELKAQGIVSQLVEDCPQLALQTVALVLQFWHGEPASLLTQVSVVSTLMMLLFKITTNMIARVLAIDVCKSRIKEAAMKCVPPRRVVMNPFEVLLAKDIVALSIQCLVFLASVTYLRFSGPIMIPLNHQVTIHGRLLMIGVLVLTYGASLVLLISYIGLKRNLLWHIISSLSIFAGLVIVATNHPILLMMASRELWKDEDWRYWRALIVLPMIRNVLMCCLLGWDAGLSNFPVVDSISIAVLILNGLGCILFLMKLNEGVRVKQAEPPDFPWGDRGDLLAINVEDWYKIVHGERLIHEWSLDDFIAEAEGTVSSIDDGHLRTYAPNLAVALVLANAVRDFEAKRPGSILSLARLLHSMAQSEDQRNWRVAEEATLILASKLQASLPVACSLKEVKELDSTLASIPMLQFETLNGDSPTMQHAAKKLLAKAVELAQHCEAKDPRLHSLFSSIPSLMKDWQLVKDAQEVWHEEHEAWIMTSLCSAPLIEMVLTKEDGATLGLKRQPAEESDGIQVTEVLRDSLVDKANRASEDERGLTPGTLIYGANGFHGKEAIEQELLAFDRGLRKKLFLEFSQGHMSL